MKWNCSVCNVNKGADQLGSYCTSAPLFSHMQNVHFLVMRLHYREVEQRITTMTFIENLYSCMFNSSNEKTVWG